jgi:glycerol kinase
MQFQADVLGVPLSRPEVIETTAFGAGALAGLGVGLFSSTQAITDVWREQRRFEPKMAQAEVQQRLAAWRTAVAKA